MAEDAQEALDLLLNRLRNTDALDIVEDIETVIARGVTEEDIESKSRSKEYLQRALDPSEAYLLAVELLVANIEPILMKSQALKNLNQAGCDSTSIAWQVDFVDGSPIAPQRHAIDIPTLEGEALDVMTKHLSSVVELLGER